MEEDQPRFSLKRLFRLVSVVGGVAAVVWAMRDRLISIPNKREEEPAPFRVKDDS